MVILYQDEFTAGAALAPAIQKREREKPPFRNPFKVMPGDSPWYCFWNATYIEGYIYVEDNSTAASFTGFPTAWTPNPFGSSVPVETGAPPTPPGGLPPPAETDKAVPAPPAVAEPPAAPAPPADNDKRATTPRPLVRRTGGDYGDYPRFAPYPRIVKIEERRLPGSPQPYCQKMRLLDDLTVVEALDEANTPIRVYLQETNPTLEEFLAGDQPPSDPTATSAAPGPDAPVQRRHPSYWQKRGDPADACHCQWMFQ